MCRLGRVRRIKYEGRRKKRCGKKWYEDRDERSRGRETPA
jgi:hypothetical protein